MSPLPTLLLVETVALVGGTAHTLAPGAPGGDGVVEHATVLIEDGRLAAVGREIELPEGCRTVDASGLHLIPGLIDGLAFHDAEHDALHVAAGVVLLRDHGNDLGRIFAARSLEERDRRGGPTLSVAGAVLDGRPPATAEALVLERVEELEANLPLLLAEEPDFLAYHARLPADVWARLLELAAEAELQVWGPRPQAVPIEELLASGQAGVVGLGQLGPGDAETVARRWAASGIAVVPLALAHAQRLPGAGPDPAPEVLGAEYAARWQAERAAHELALAGEVERGTGAAARAELLERLRALHDAGVPLVPGSGAPLPWIAPGRGLLEELALWQEAGLAPAEVLRLATAGAARALGLADERGTLEPGRVADVVALRADPREDVRALAEVELVVLRGRVIERAELERGVDAAREAAEAARARALRPLNVAAPRLPESQGRGELQVLLRGYAETRSLAERLAAERWAVARDHAGRLELVGRVVLPAAGEAPDGEMHVRQRLDADGRLESFEVELDMGGRRLVARGLLRAGSLAVERRLDGAFLDNQSTSESIAALDVGSVTTYVVLGHARRAGNLAVLRLHEGLEGEIVPWKLRVEPDGRHVFLTPDGPRVATYLPSGVPADVVAQRGSGFTRTTVSELEVVAPPGLPLHASKPRPAAPPATPARDER